MIPRLLLFFSFLLLSLQAYATHIAGGEFELKHVSNYSYRLSLSLYFDEINGRQNQKIPSINVTIFEKDTDRIVRTTSLSRIEISSLDYANVGCTISDLKTSKLLYSKIIYLDPAIFTNPAGYYVVWERCCRNSTTNNIVSTPEAGTAIYMEFPAVVKNGTFFKNSSPKLTPPPSEYACQGELFYYDFGSTDPDGDQLVYDMVSPLNGHSTTENPAPTPSSAPYAEINWRPGYSKDNQIQGNPPVDIDRNTGRLTVNPKYVGLFAFSVRCQEFRNGVKIGEVRRDFQLLVKACSRNNAPATPVVQHESPTPYADGQVLRIGPAASRCLKVLYTDPDADEALTLAVEPVNFTNDNIFSLTGTTSGVVNTSSGNQVLEASICFEKCFDTNGGVYELDLIVSDDGDNGCSLPRQTTRRISVIVEKAQDNPPAIALSTPQRAFEVYKGDRIDFDVTGTDADNEQVAVSAKGRGFNLNSQNIMFGTASGAGQATAPFTWEIDRKIFNQLSYLIDFTVTSVSACGLTRTSTETIEVIPLRRNDMANNTISVDQTICAGETPATLSGSLPTGGTESYEYTWEVSTTDAESGFEPAPGAHKAQHYAPSFLTETSWFRRKVDSGLDDELTSSTVKITVQQTIGNNTISSAQVICASSAPALLTGSLPTGGSGTYTYQWEYSTTGPTSGFKSVNEAGKGKEKDYQPGILNQTTWYRRVVTSPPCPPVISQPIEITVMPAINWNTITGNQVVCVGNSPNKLTGPLATGSQERYTYAWEISTKGATDGFTPAPGHHTAPDYAIGQVQQPTWFRRIVRSAACQSTSNAVLVSMEALPAMASAMGDTICSGDRATLQASAAAGVLLEWYDKPAGGKLLHKGATYQTSPLQATTDFYVQAVSRNGCASTDRVKVTATVRPATAYAGEDVRIMEGQFAKLQATGGTSYSWSPATGINFSVPDPTVKPQTTTTYTVTVTSEYGCVSTDEVTVTVLPHIAPTNAITVNGDNINETWYIKNIEHYPNCRVQIFTRWGNKIYDSTGYREPWNGTHNGMPLPMAAYYYIIDLGMNEKPVSGSITIIK